MYAEISFTTGCCNYNNKTILVGTVEFVLKVARIEITELSSSQEILNLDFTRYKIECSDERNKEKKPQADME